MSMLTLFKERSTLLFGLIFVVYAVLWAPQGLDTKDGGFMLGIAWRILHGEVPYRDIFYVRPPIPLYLRSLPLLLGNFAIYADRIMSLVQFAVIAIAGSAVLFQSLHRNNEPSLFWSFAICCFIMSVHNFALFGWYTTDAVFFAALALLAFMRRHYLLCGALAAASLMCKQNFALITLLFGLMAGTCGVRAAINYLFGAAGVIGVIALIMRAQGSLEPMVVLIFGVGNVADIWNTGVKAYVEQLLTPDAAVAVGVAGVTGIGAHLTGRSAAEARTVAYTAFVLAILAMFLAHALALMSLWAVIKEKFVFIMLFFYGSSMMFVFAGAWTIDWARRNRGLFQRAPSAFLSESLFPLAALFAIAWTSSISFGYMIPAYFAVPMLAPILLDPLPVSTVSRQLWLITAFAFVAFGVALAHPYGESSRIDRLVLVPPVVHGAAFMRTSLRSAGKLQELAALIAQNPNRAISVLPAFTSFDLLFGMKPPSPVVWSYDADYPPAKRPAYTTAVLNRLCEAHALVAVEKDIAAAFQHKNGMLYSSVLAYVEKMWHPIGETAYFALFDSPESC
jgi:hypothetical protein